MFYFLWEIGSTSSSNLNTESLLIVLFMLDHRQKRKKHRYRFWWGFKRCTGGEGKCYQVFPSQVSYLVGPSFTNGYSALSLFLRHKGR